MESTSSNLAASSDLQQEKVKQLTQKSIQTLRRLLTDAKLPAQDRALVALQLLERMDATSVEEASVEKAEGAEATGAAAEGQVTVTILLEGGHHYALAVTADSPLLRQLVSHVLVQSEGHTAPPELLQIPIRGGRAAVYVPSHQLVGLEFHPALVLEQTGTAPTNAAQTAVAQTVPAQPVSATLPKVGTGDRLLPARVVQIDGFLSAQENAAALQTALTKEDQFVGSKVFTDADRYRRSSVLYATLYPELYALVKDKILAVLPSVLAQLAHPSFPVGRFEMQLTAHNDGCYYKTHNDSGSPNTASRELTYVYYFHQEPAGFSGGELKIYDTILTQAGGFESGSSGQVVIPRNNSIVFFDSRLRHEVMPVVCPSKLFSAGRFTLNGWLRHAEPLPPKPASNS